MPSLEIIKSGLLTSVQDMGRKGLAYYAIPHSGVMDKNAAKIALLLLHKDETHPLIECTSIAPQILFHTPTQIAITGADFNWTINDEKITRNNVIAIKQGDVLKGNFAKDGLRAYIAIDGLFKLDKIYNSYATHTNAKIGGWQGRLLKKGDILEWEKQEILSSSQVIIPIKKGPEFDYLNEEAKRQLNANIYQVGADSNRMGIRLSGPKLESLSYQLGDSSPVLPGFIQLPPSGLPIIVLQDGQTSGGYPRIAYVQDKYLSKLNQIPLGGKFRFELI